ncbi:MAG: vWA domain-containing protein, partial [Patescibacteria group bacterium]|nr:vWA domain-containing protein [Patescibacteria group bacterium]
MRFTLNPIADSYLLVFLAAAVLLALLLVRPKGGKLSRGRQVGLVALRAGVIALVLLLMLRPTLVYTETTRQAATLVVLVDQSRSMSVRDMLQGKSRWAALHEAIDAAADDLRRVAREFELRAYTFDRTVQRLNTDDGAVTLPDELVGEETALGAALEEVLRQEAGKRLLGVLLLSDGAQRAYPPLDTPPQSAAAALRRLGYPMFTFPFGQSRGLGQAQDAAVTKLLVSPTVFVKNRLAVAGEVRADGYVNRTLPVRLLFETEPGKMQVVAQQDVQVTTSGQLLPVQLDFAPQVPG